MFANIIKGVIISWNMEAEKVKKKKKEEKTLYKILGIIADIIMYPILIVSLVAALAMLYTNRNTQMPAIFGVSVVKIMSDSMVEAGFDVGDIVFVKKTDTNTLKTGDVVAFYKYFDNVDGNYYNKLVHEDEYNGENLGETITGRTSLAKLKEEPRPVYFHRIKNVYYLPNDGSIFFETAGSGENDSDGFIRSDYVVGKYINTPVVVREAMNFCSSSVGMILLVVLPLSILVLLECLSIVEQINNMIIENKVFYREEPYNSEDSIKAHIGRDMELYRQVYFYATAKDEDRENIKDFLWSELYEEDITKKQLILREQIEKSLQIFSEDKLQYFEYWENILTGPFERKKFQKLKNQFKVEYVLLSQMKGKSNIER